MARRFVGLMSGTSLDGVDGVLIEIESDRPGAHGIVRTIGEASAGFPGDLRRRLLSLAASEKPAPHESELEIAAVAANELAHRYAEVVERLVNGAGACEVRAIGAHGQTIRHRPEHGFSVQLLNGALLAELTGIPVVCDLRAADLAAGGEGAPLAPAFHRAVFGHAAASRSVLNLGGIANLSVVAPTDGPGEKQAVVGFDTGPASTLLDAWTSRHLGQPFDEDGRWAASGKTDPTLLAALLDDPYFGREAPKSTGREHFNLTWLDSMLARCGRADLGAADVQRTLVELTACSIADAIARACKGHPATPRDDAAIYCCGGGVRNGFLMGRIAARLAPSPIRTTADLGIAPQAVEAAAFAWLAQRRVDGLPGNLPSVTGAYGPRILGALHEASSARSCAR
ncbi:MAG: anhydro-N-acetylmuramic acid kinase [Burkholderiaceae bacterium]|nr:anhydro-N-acetylmuramic acid kinase [Burkholderiaceae bacterium]